MIENLYGIKLPQANCVKDGIVPHTINIVISGGVARIADCSVSFSKETESSLSEEGSIRRMDLSDKNYSEMFSIVCQASVGQKSFQKMMQTAAMLIKYTQDTGCYNDLVAVSVSKSGNYTKLSFCDYKFSIYITQNEKLGSDILIGTAIKEDLWGGLYSIVLESNELCLNVAIRSKEVPSFSLKESSRFDFIQVFGNRSIEEVRSFLGSEDVSVEDMEKDKAVDLLIVALTSKVDGQKTGCNLKDFCELAYKISIEIKKGIAAQL